MKYRYRTHEEMKDSGIEWIGEIPREWQTTKLKMITKNIGRGKSPEYVENSNVKVINQACIYWDGLKLNNVKFQDEKLNYIRAKLLKGDLLINSTGTGTLGRCNIFNEDGNYICDSHVTVMRFNKFINSKYINYCISTKLYQELIYSTMVTGSTNQIELSREGLRNMDVLICHNNELKRIINFLDKKTSQFDLIISKKEALIEKLEEAKKSLISEVVTGKVKVVKTEEGYDVVPRSSEEMKDSGVEWIGLVPKEWEIKRLRFLGGLQNGISKSSEEFGYGFPFVSYGDVYRNMSLPQSVNGLVNSSANDRRIYSVEQGDVFFTRTSETIDEIGISSVCLESIPEATFAGFLIRFRPNNKLLFRGFSKYYFRCILNRNYFVKEMNLVTRASLSQNLLNNLSVVLPTYKEQENIYLGLEYKIGTIDNIIEKIKSEIQKLKEAKQSLITEAVTGKIEILD